MSKTYDVIIVGMGVAGLMTALELPKHLSILMLSKEEAYASNSYLAQGGMCVLKDDADYASYYEDTMRAGHYENNPLAVKTMIVESPEILHYLDGIGVPFEKENNEWVYTKEGAHSHPRIVHYEDCTGKIIVEHLLAQVEKRTNVKIQTHTQMIDWCVVNETKITGIVVREKERVYTLKSDAVVLATGGIGGRYASSTNQPSVSGDSFELAKKYHVTLKDMDYVQIHPTTFYSEEKGRRFLITEAVRGEGGWLLNHKGERFVDELLPRDKVTEAILEEMKKENQPYMWLSFEPIETEHILKHFPSIYKHCLAHGYDITKEKIPVVPAQHYFMGGIAVDLFGQTSMQGLYAVGETSCTGVHGKNRLASNSLLEAMVFARRLAKRLQITTLSEVSGVSSLTKQKNTRAGRHLAQIS